MLKVGMYMSAVIGDQAVLRRRAVAGRRRAAARLRAGGRRDEAGGALSSSACAVRVDVTRREPLPCPKLFLSTSIRSITCALWRGSRVFVAAVSVCVSLLFIFS